MIANQKLAEGPQELPKILAPGESWLYTHRVLIPKTGLAPDQKFMVITLSLLDPKRDNKKFGDSLHGVIEITNMMAMRFDEIDDQFEASRIDHRDTVSNNLFAKGFDQIDQNCSKNVNLID